MIGRLVDVTATLSRVIVVYGAAAVADHERCESPGVSGGAIPVACNIQSLGMTLTRALLASGPHRRTARSSRGG